MPKKIEKPNPSVLEKTLDDINSFFQSRRTDIDEPCTQPIVTSSSLKAERETEKETELLDLIQGFYDIQNGPPLEKYRDQWEALMSKASEVLANRNHNTDAP